MHLPICNLLNQIYLDCSIISIWWIRVMTLDVRLGHAARLRLISHYGLPILWITYLPSQKTLEENEGSA